MNWRQLQSEFRSRLEEPEAPPPAQLQASAAPALERRFNVYRNNVTTSLVEAILATYPVVTRLVGDAFAREMARVYVQGEPPRSPVLIHYGESFADFIQRFPPAAVLPYLSDVARLEWAWLRAYHAADAAPVAIDALGEVPEDQLGELTFSFLPSAQLLSFSNSALSIWAAHQGEGEPEPGPIGDGPERGLVVRPRMNVEVRPLSPALFAFLSELKRGLTLGAAVEAMSAQEKFDAAAFIAAPFELQLVASVRLIQMADG